MRWIGWAPNVLSALRLVLAVTFAWVPREWWIPVIVVAGLSDFADGFIARRYHASSWAGGLLDAVADKLFVLMVLIVMAKTGAIEAWEAALLMSRDISVAFIALYAAATSRWHAFRKMPSRLFGKLTTASMLVLFVLLAIEPDKFWTVAMLVITAALSVIAAVDYFMQFVRGLRSESNPPPPGDPSGDIAT